MREGEEERLTRRIGRADRGSYVRRCIDLLSLLVRFYFAVHLIVSQVNLLLCLPATALCVFFRGSGELVTKETAGWGGGAQSGGRVQDSGRVTG